ncbi:MAG: ATP-binding protein [Elusimicrobiota bacterium]|jgi:signal transduction histidine kinase
MDDPNLERSRAMMRRTLLEMESLRRAAAPPGERRRYTGPRAWRLLRRTLERVQQVLGRVREGSWPDPVSSRPEWERRRRELEARSLRAESAQRELERRRQSDGAEWDRVFSELEAVQEGWLLLQKELPAGDPAATLAALQERLARVEVLFGELLEEESQLQRERALVDRLWRWLSGVWVPAAEEGIPEGAAQEAWSSMRRRVGDLDRRWRSSLLDLKRVLTEEESSRWRERCEEAERRADALSRDLLALREGRLAEGSPSSLEPQLAAQGKALEDARARLQQERAEKEALAGDSRRLEEKVLSLERGLENARRKRKEAELLRDAAARESERARAQERASSSEAASLQARLDSAEGSLREAQENLHRLEAAASREVDLLRQNAALRSSLDALQCEVEAQAELVEKGRRTLAAALRARRRALAERRAAFDAVEEVRSRGGERLEAAREVSFQREKELRDRVLKDEAELDALRRQLALERAAAGQAVRVMRDERDAWRQRVSSALDEFSEHRLEPLRVDKHRLEDELLAAQKELHRLRQGSEDERRRLELEVRGLQDRLAALAAEADLLRSQPPPLVEPPPPPAPVAPAPVPTPEPAAPPEPAETGLPSIEPVLDPAWARVVERLRASLTSSFAYLRRLAAGRLPDGQKALLKMAAGEIVKSQDTLRVLAEYLGDPPEGVPHRAETTLDSALTAWEPALRRRRIALVRRLEPCPQVRVHPETLRMAFYQLLRNAYEAMPRGGTLTVRCAVGEGGTVGATFTDTGGGFVADAFARLFEPFFTTKAGHLGLGLAFARRAAVRYGGTLSAENVLGGAAVRLSLPPAEAAAEEPPALDPSNLQE